MFVGRAQELESLNRLAARGSFQMVVVYGRRRVGKTALIQEFAKDKPTLFFTAQQKSDALNLRAFSREAYRFFGAPESAGAFADWASAFSFVAEQAQQREPFVFAFDEFPYAAQANPSLPSTLQIAIDHSFKQTGVFMIICGSNEGFMESEVLGAKSPLYGRRTGQVRLHPLEYREAARLMPTDDPESLVTYYATFGGTPYYLLQLDPSLSYEDNVRNLCFDMAGPLYAEPQMLLRQELREPALYSSVLDAVASGATAPKRIAERSGVEEGTVSRYLKTLTDLGIVERVRSFGEGKRGRRSIYRLADPFFAYWYRFVSPHVSMVENGLGGAAARLALGDPLSTYIGKQFESVCLQWLVGEAREGRLPFMPTEFGTWWGPDPEAHEQVDIDVVVGNKREKALIAGECKWRNAFDETEAIRNIAHRATLIGGYDDRRLVLFTKRSVSEATAEKAAEMSNLRVVTAADLYV